MTARILDGRALAATIYAEVAAGIENRVAGGGSRPYLATVLVGNDPGSEAYIRMKHRNCELVGIESSDHRLPAASTTAEVLELVSGLNADDRVSGILVQMPMPAQIDAAIIIDAVDPVKDVDGYHPLNLGHLTSGTPVVVPCTPAGIMELLRRNRVPLEGARAVVLGRSNTVGKPAALLLVQANATVTICHSRTRAIHDLCREADILVSAIGQPHFVRAEHVKPGAAVIDVGVNHVHGKLVGDVDPAAAEVAGWLTPNPGGVGPMTRAMLISNTYEAEARRKPL